MGIAITYCHSLGCRIADKVNEYIKERFIWKASPSIYIGTEIYEVSLGIPPLYQDWERVPVSRFLRMDDQEGMVVDYDAIDDYVASFYDARLDY